MDELKLRNVHLQQVQNQIRHRTDGLSSSSLVLRRGQPFTILINYDGRPFDPLKDKLVFWIVLGPLSVEMPVSVSGNPSPSQWSAILERRVPDPNAGRTQTVSLFSPASSSVGVYTLHLRVETRGSIKTHVLGQFTLLCNPWCQADSVFLQSEDLRDEYIRNDFGLLFKGSPGNIESRPWSFDQYEKGILDTCMKLLQLSPQSQADVRKDLLNRSSPVYISRVISAMVNCQDDKGVLMGNWSGKYSDGVNPSTWSGSADVLRTWAETQFSPVRYGQCWVFAAVMCTVMRALGIPTRVITNFNSAHDTNKNMVIEEYYSEKGEKLSIGRDSVWNFHVWVESWMKRPDLDGGYDGWQVLDPTPQEMSAGTYRCGPAAVKAVHEQKVNAPYDVPFVYAEVNADVHRMIIRDGKILATSVDKDTVGALICTKRPGPAMLMQDITSEYKTEMVRKPFMFSSDGKSFPQGVGVSLQLLKAPVVGENLSFNVIITNNMAIPKLLRKHVSAQNKEYNRNPTGSFWEAHDDLKIGPCETVTVKHEISFNKYMLNEAMEDYLVNLAVVIEDVKSQERVLASEEFNISSPALNIQIQNEYSVIINTQQVATVTFTNPFNVAVSGDLVVVGSGLLEEKVQMRLTLQPRETMRRPIRFIPRMTGAKMLHASLELTDQSTVLRGFKTVTVQAA
ncbi:transglutaminase 5, like [Rhinichthys klamathensis goyatoka]|uniref:transglutaminase 5, like n=1 Tax=Rhinichthys klamathensis goyatoka TaxID=3034132 RepID=UPI0024B5A368|nr:transglutaminase 5, like [Rhinichthys klamathensis goyatoka]